MTVLLWLLAGVAITIAAAVGQYHWNKRHPDAIDFSDYASDDDSQTEPWEGY